MDNKSDYRENDLISIIIPVYNMVDQIETCLEAIYASTYRNFEIIVVDDGSIDNTLSVVQKFPCRVICLDQNSGAARARNTGANNSRGKVLFFTDADCILQKNTLSLVHQCLQQYDNNTIVGGTYSLKPFDRDFFSKFQSVFVHFSECKNPIDPDYIATHAFVIQAETFHKNGGFSENFLPILDDVEFSHRLKTNGCQLVINPAIIVTHMFGFNLRKSLVNAQKKTMYWIIYSLKNGDLFNDSGTASVALKLNVVLLFSMLSLTAMDIILNTTIFIKAVPWLLLVNMLLNKNLFKLFYASEGPLFAARAFFYYCFIYPIPIIIGAVRGLAQYFFHKQK